MFKTSLIGFLPRGRNLRKTVKKNKNKNKGKKEGKWHIALIVQFNHLFS